MNRRFALIQAAFSLVALGGIFAVVVFGILRKTTLPSDRPLIVAGAVAALIVAGAVVFEVLRRRGALERVRAFIRPLAGAPRALLSRWGLLLFLVSVGV